MTNWEEMLLGELVGLARATDGNEHLITQAVTEMIAEVLRANVRSESGYHAYSGKIDAAKREMVPDCFLCANPCGRTSALDLKNLKGESQQIQETKLAILSKIRTISCAERSQDDDLKLYRGMVILGLEGYSPEELTALFESS